MTSKTVSSAIRAATVVFAILSAGTGIASAAAPQVPGAAVSGNQASGPQHSGYVPVQHRFDERNWRHGPRGDNRWGAPRFCSPREAVQKAHRMGLRHAGVARVNNRAIVVAGHHWGHRAHVVFARNSRHCSVIGVRGLRGW